MLTRDEKSAIARYLATEHTPGSLWWEMSPYLLPPVAFAIYGAWRREVDVVTIAFAVLLALVVWYLSYANSKSKHLLSAVRKYEDALKALHEPDSQAT